MAKSKLLPITRTLRWLNGLPGVLADKCEYTMGQFIRKDAFGFADVVAVGWRGHPASFIQVTSATNQSSRRRKILGLTTGKHAEASVKVAANVRRVLEAGCCVYLVYWYAPEEEAPKVEQVYLRDEQLDYRETPLTIEEWRV